MTASPSHAQQQLAVLVDVARRMSETFELGPLLRAAEAAALATLDCERATIFLYDRSAHELHSTVATGTGEIRFSADRGIAGEAVRTGRVIVVPDAYADPRFNPEIDRRTGYRTRNLLTIPLAAPDGEIIGALQLLNKRSGRFEASDEPLAVALGSLIGMAIKRQQLLDAAAEKDRLEHDLDIARQIQMQMLPRSNPRISGFDVAGWNRPADQTGGDCYSFMDLPDGRLLFLIADASGHGIGPALVVTQCRAMIRAMAPHIDDWAVIAGRVNNLLCQDLAGGRFVTTCFGTLDPAAGRITYVSAGHGPLLWLHARTNRIDTFGASGLPLGIMEDSEYALAPAVDLEPGDIFCIVTDGFIEWTRPGGELYGEERLGDILSRHRHLTGEELIEAVYQDVRAFSGGTPQADDLTLVLIKRQA